MRDLILKAIEEDTKYMTAVDDEGNLIELDVPFYEGRIEALNWVLRNLPEEG